MCGAAGAGQQRQHIYVHVHAPAGINCDVMKGTVWAWIPPLLSPAPGAQQHRHTWRIFAPRQRAATRSAVLRFRTRSRRARVSPSWIHLSDNC